MSPVAAKFTKAHWACCSAAASRIGITAGSSSEVDGTRPGLSTSSRLSHAVAGTTLNASTVAARTRLVAKYECMGRLRRSESEAERSGEARRGRKDRLIAVGQLPDGADLRIPHVLLRDVDVDLAVARRAPSMLCRPEHRHISARNADRSTRGTDAPQIVRRHRVRRRQLAETQEAGFVGAGCVGFVGAVELQERIVALDYGLGGTLVVQPANLGVRLPVTTVAIDARIETQTVVEEDGGVEPCLPRRLRVSPEDTRRLRARNFGAALLEPGLARPTVACRRRQDRARGVDLR